MRSYREFYDSFDIEELEKILVGNFRDGLNVCVEICDRWADSDKVALRYEGVSRPASAHTFAELKEDSARFANFLRTQGIGKGDRVACLLPRTPELLVAALGTLRAGAVYQPLFTAFGSGAIEYRLSRAGTRLVVTDPDNLHKLEAIGDRPPVLLVNREEDEHPEHLDLKTELSAQSAEFEPVMIGPDDPFLQMFTSGTVGKSKGVAVPARALLAFYMYMRFAMDVRPEDRFWNVADPGWAYGLYYAVVGPLMMGITTHFNEHGFTPKNTLEMLRKYSITNLAAAPTAYRMLMANDHIFKEDLSLRVASSAGEPLNPEAIAWVKKRLGCTVMDHYGQTETGMTVCNHHALEQEIVRTGSMGFAMPGYRVAALDKDLREVGEGETGELAVDVERSPMFFFQGYTWEEKDPFAGGYYLTGDVVVSHGDGGFSFCGRDDDIILTAGYRVGPADVESTLLEHESVAESGVVGKPDPERGEIIKAYVVLREGFEPGDGLARELKTLVRNRLSAHAFPREIEFVDELPKTPSGKIQRFVLRNRAIEDADSKEAAG